MEHAAEPVSPVHTALISCHGGRTDQWIRRFQPEGPVGTVAVVVPDVDAKDLLQMASANGQQPVQALGADRPHPALRECVRPGRLHGRQQHLGTLGAEHVAEAPAELRVPVAEQEP